MSFDLDLDNGQWRVAAKFCVTHDNAIRAMRRKGARNRRRANHWNAQHNKWAAKVDPLSNHLCDGGYVA